MTKDCRTDSGHECDSSILVFFFRFESYSTEAVIEMESIKFYLKLETIIKILKKNSIEPLWLSKTKAYTVNRSKIIIVKQLFSG